MMPLTPGLRAESGQHERKAPLRACLVSTLLRITSLGLHCDPVRQGSLPSAHTQRNGSSQTKRLSQELTLVRWALQMALDGFSKLLENYPWNKIWVLRELSEYHDQLVFPLSSMVRFWGKWLKKIKPQGVLRVNTYSHWQWPAGAEAKALSTGQAQGQEGLWWPRAEERAHKWTAMLLRSSDSTLCS